MLLILISYNHMHLTMCEYCTFDKVSLGMAFVLVSFPDPISEWRGSGDWILPPHARRRECDCSWSQEEEEKAVTSVFLYSLFVLTVITGAFRWYWGRGGSGIPDWPGPCIDSLGFAPWDPIPPSPPLAPPLLRPPPRPTIWIGCLLLGSERKMNHYIKTRGI